MRARFRNFYSLWKSQDLVLKAQCVSNRCKDLFKRKKYFGVIGTLSLLQCCTLTISLLNLALLTWSQKYDKTARKCSFKTQTKRRNIIPFGCDLGQTTEQTYQTTSYRPVNHRRPKRKMRGIIDMFHLTYANVTLAFERCCVTKMRFTRVCMGILRVCFKYLKCNVVEIKLTYSAFLSSSLLFHGVWGRFEVRHHHQC